MKISIIIPTLNEAPYLRRTMLHTKQMASSPEQLEFLVVDAGSNDDTLETVQDLTAQTYVKEDFMLQKHKSLNFGMEQASGDVLVFLDADTLLPRHFDLLIDKQLEKNKVIGGAFEMRFVDPDLKLTLLSRFNSLRYNIWKTYYGDQAIFCRKHLAVKAGGFPDTLMEAAHFCRTLKKHGRLRIIKEPVLTSPRRFKNGGFWKVFWFDVKMWIRFVFGLDLKRSQSTYWKTNLQNG